MGVLGLVLESWERQDRHTGGSLVDGHQDVAAIDEEGEIESWVSSICPGRDSKPDGMRPWL